ncbi:MULTISPECIES: DUF6118 family protein [unclassified Sphingomonas]|uniref:DUF6118 family protein n=1 Tax=unclassified Sphingomonas TaxID=196159 RepID=UPI0025DFE8B8|nr:MULTISPECIES: DUF6118 family protein [unclassified Sphingomonas]
MLNEPEPQPATAAEAFARLAARVAGMEERIERRVEMLTRAVEHVAAEKQNIEIPDYSPTLAKIGGVLANMTARMKGVEEAPALQITPETLAERMNAAAITARKEDQAALAEAKQKHVDAAHTLGQLVGRVTAHRDQRRRLLWTAVGGALAGCLLWSFFPGTTARALPASWHLPERLAAHIVGEPTLWESGIRLMRAGSPQAWGAITAAAQMRRDNRDTIAACEQAAAKAKQPVRCTIRIDNAQP